MYDMLIVTTIAGAILGALIGVFLATLVCKRKHKDTYVFDCSKCDYHFESTNHSLATTVGVEHMKTLHKNAHG